MAEKIYNLHEAKTHLSRLVNRAAAGDEIVIAKSGVPLAKLVPLASAPKRRRRPGGWKGRVRIAGDFDAPLPADLAGAFEGRRRRRRFCSTHARSGGGAPGYAVAQAQLQDLTC